MAISMYDTRTMLKAIEQIKPARSFLKDTFFSNTDHFETEQVDVDIVKGKRRMAPFVHPRIGGKTVDHTGYQTKFYKAPLISPDCAITGDLLLKRLAGEHIYSGNSPEQRQLVLIGKKLAEFDEMITRREEWMAAQALFEGRIPIRGEGVNEIIDFGFTNKETLTGIAKWNDQTNSEPLGDLKRWKRKIVQLSGVNPTHCIMGFDAIDAFLEHPAVLKSFDLKKVDNGTIDPQLLPNGVIYHGYLKELGLDIYSYEEWYIDPEDDKEKTIVPQDKVLLASANAGFKLLYGAIIDVNEGIFSLPRVPKSWIKNKPSARILQLSGRPLPVPFLVDSFYVGTVV